MSSYASASSGGSTRSSIVYTRDDLLAIGTSPSSNANVSPAFTSVLVSIPEIMRESRRGVLEAYKALDYSRNEKASGSNSSSRRKSAKQNKRQTSNSSQASSSKATQPRTESRKDSRTIQSQPILPLISAKADLYVPPRRRSIASPQQAIEERQRQLSTGRGRSGSLSRQSRTNVRSWLRPMFEPLAAPLNAVHTTNGLSSAILAGW
ncbi:hypothetical protein M422DRAFT_23676 [Sphaerobolus stellatus SS14]|nr:hypothetical protein M422DRAFT_23676 [Sphaerobolus stellatus SS14]